MRGNPYPYGGVTLKHDRAVPSSETHSQPFPFLRSCAGDALAHGTGENGSVHGWVSRFVLPYGCFSTRIVCAGHLQVLRVNSTLPPRSLWSNCNATSW